LLTKETMQC